MRIKEVRAYHQDLGTSRPYTIAYKTVTEVIIAFVEIELENGIIGIGCANPSKAVVGEDVQDTISRLTSDNLSYLEGQDIRSFEGLIRDTAMKFEAFPGVNVAVDVALHDAFTQFLGIPLVDFFGRKHHALPTSITIGIKNIEETLAESQEYHERGFNVIKVKTGLNPEEDAERVIRIQERFPKMKIRVDANQGYTPADLTQFVDLSKNVALELIEQPFPVDRFDQDVKSLGENESKLLVADESLRNAKDALHLLSRTDNCRIFNIKLMKSGGLYGAREISQIARRSDVSLMWGCNDESAVTIAAALHLALACEHTRYIDLDGSLDLLLDVVSGGFKIEHGVMSTVEGPGLGVRIKK